MFMKLFKFLSMIFPRFSLINMTLAHALGDIFVFAVLMLVIIAAFTGLYFFSYGTYFREFSTLPRTAYWVIMNVALLADPSEFFEVDPVTSTFLLVISTALGTWLFSTIIIAVITESFLKCKAEIAARLAAAEQEKLQWMGKLLAWLADPEPYVPVLEHRARRVRSPVAGPSAHPAPPPATLQVRPRPPPAQHRRARRRDHRKGGVGRPRHRPRQHLALHLGAIGALPCVRRQPLAPRRGGRPQLAERGRPSHRARRRPPWLDQRQRRLLRRAAARRRELVIRRFALRRGRRSVLDISDV